VALLLAFATRERIEFLGITTVAGNVGLGITTANALRIRDLSGHADVPIFAGADRPLLVDLETAEYICGPDGLAGSGLPPPASTVVNGHAVDFLIRTLRDEPAGTITLCPVGPLTNIALALRMAPDIAPRIKRIVLMGGAMGLGNVTPAAEFNIYVDPHAAAVVFSAGIPITMMGLHLTHQAICDETRLARLAALGTRTGQSVHGMLTRPRASGMGKGHPMHDPCCIAWLLWPELFTGRDCFVDVETHVGPQRGRTTIDWNNRLKRPPNAFVPDKVDAPALFDRLIDSIASLP
jgi:purine nucleosidase